MGSLFKSRTTTTQQPYESNPWKPQQEFLIEGFNQGQNALESGLSNIGGITDFTANLTPEQLSSLGIMSNLGTGAAQNLGSSAMTAGMGVMGNFGQFGQNARDIHNQAGVDPTQGIISNAAAYAADPFLQGQIDAALGDVRKTFDRTVGDINSGAVATGNMNSTRAGAMEAIAQDEAMDRAAAISSQMRGQAYQMGLDRAMATDDMRFNRQFAANEMLGNSGMQGFGLATAGLGAGMTGADAALRAGSITQAQNQAEIDGQIAGAALPLDFVSRYMSAIGGNYGSQGFTTQIQQRPSIFQQLAGGAIGLAGAGFKMPFMRPAG